MGWEIAYSFPDRSDTWNDKARSQKRIKLRSKETLKAIMRVRLQDSNIQVIKVGVKFIGLQHWPGIADDVTFSGVVSGNPFVEQYVISKALTPAEQTAGQEHDCEFTLDIPEGLPSSWHDRIVYKLIPILSTVPTGEVPRAEIIKHIADVDNIMSVDICESMESQMSSVTVMEGDWMSFHPLQRHFELFFSTSIFNRPKPFRISLTVPRNVVLIGEKLPLTIQYENLMAISIEDAIVSIVPTVFQNTAADLQTYGRESERQYVSISCPPGGRGWQHITVRVPDFKWPTIRSKYTHVFLSYLLRLSLKFGGTEKREDVELPLALVDRANVEVYRSRVASRLIPTLSYQNLKSEYVRAAGAWREEPSPNSVMESEFQVKAGSVPWLISEAQCYSVEGIRVVGLPLLSGSLHNARGTLLLTNFRLLWFPTSVRRTAQLKEEHKKAMSLLLEGMTDVQMFGGLLTEPHITFLLRGSQYKLALFFEGNVGPQEFHFVLQTVLANAQWGHPLVPHPKEKPIYLIPKDRRARWLCLLCRQTTVECLVLPCAHLLFCRACLGSRTTCPYCNAEIDLIKDVETPDSLLRKQKREYRTALAEARAAPLTDEAPALATARSLADPFFSGKLTVPAVLPPHLQKLLDETEGTQVATILDGYPLDTKLQVNLAVFGQVGTGKSALITTLLGDHIGREAHDTLGCKKWTSTELPSLAFWEFNGQSKPPLPAFDALLLVCVDHFGDEELAVVRRAFELKIPLLFVLNKAELSMESEGKLASLKHVVAQQLEQAGVLTPFLYLTSSEPSAERLIVLDEDKLMSDIVLIACSRQ